MGIQGLLPFLKKIHTPVNISQFKGCTVAIDAYCWLHKGAFSCAEKLALGEKTEQYVYYCMKYVDCLLRNDLKPILVFDGCHLPSKKDVEVSRRERREVNRKKAAQLLREGKRQEAKECLQRCVDITPQMALQLMNACRARGVDCIVAPYEADAQLAYLNKAGIAQVIITEDSDLLLFGCEKVIFKMDFFGNGVLIEQSRLNEVVDIQDGFYTFEKFRYMCILSGCDYLPSLPGIGLAKACKVFKVARQTDIRQLLRKIPSYLKMSLVVTDDYIDGFIRADNTFLYQLAFDPRTGRLCPLTPYLPEVEIEELRYAGPYFSNQLALQIALGNVDIHTHEKIADFDPHTYIPKHSKKQSDKRHMLSIWNPGYRPLSKTDLSKTEAEEADSHRPCLAGKEVQVKNTVTKRSPVKRVREVIDSIDVKTDTELTDLYSQPKVQRKRRKDSDELALDPSTHVPSKLPKLADSDEDTVDVNSQQTAKKQVLSPSKLSNQAHRKPVMTADDALSLIDQESAVAAMPEEKENGKAPRRNKFAVSALARRAKFSLDAPALPNVKVEVRSRYFSSSTPTLSTSSLPVHENNDQDDAVSATENKSSSAHVSKAQKETSVDDSSVTSSKIDQSDVDKSTSKDKIEHVSFSPVLEAKDKSVLSKFCYRNDKKTQHDSSKSTDSLRQGSSSQSKTSGKLSPGSAFSWPGFKFSKSSSTPTLSSFVHINANSNKPFKRVQSETKCEDEDIPSPKFEPSGSQRDCSEASQNSVEAVSNISQSSRRLTSSQSQGDDGDSISQLAVSEGSVADMDSSQHSNLYSIDSDCFPGSQDIVDLTDCDSVSGKSGNHSDQTSPATSQSSLKSPRSTPKTPTGVGAKKCRVSGLSRGKKKTAPGVDEKQQKIRDMFSRFAHHK
ncbi:uncharacterized protein LOC143281736 [Babylonia areolata]|uniref:uncharacterized protein LOC143281736 n=1 Tax=Babylonia areolata TaxID=304850 RepID=UPI003FD20403